MAEVKINLKENKCYIVSDQRIFEMEVPSSGHGNHTIYWVDGKMDRMKNESVIKPPKEKRI